MTAPATAGGGSGTAGFDYSNWADKNREAIMADPYQFGLNALADDSGKLATKGLGVAGMLTANPLLIGGSVVAKNTNKVQNIAEANAALKVMEAKGLSDTDQYKTLERQIKSAVADLPMLTEGAVKTGFAGSGDKYYKALTKTTDTTPSKPGLAAPTPSKSGTPKSSTGGPARAKSTPAPAETPAKSESYKATQEQIQKSKDIASGKTAAAGKSYSSKGGYRSGRAEGGLVKKDAKAKTKGLASK